MPRFVVAEANLSAAVKAVGARGGALVQCLSLVVLHVDDDDDDDGGGTSRRRRSPVKPSSVFIPRENIYRRNEK